MTENRFDKEIKEALEDYQMDMPSSDWSVMNEKLNEEFGFQDDPVLEKEFDNSISNKMNADLSEYNHAHWDLLLKRLEKEEEKHFHATIRKILRYVALVLLFISIWNWQGNNLFESEPRDSQIVNNNKAKQENKNTEATAASSTLIASALAESENLSAPEVIKNRSTARSSSVSAAISPQNIATRIIVTPANDLTIYKSTETENVVLADNTNLAGKIISTIGVKNNLSVPAENEMIAFEESTRLDLLALDKLDFERTHKNKTPTLDFQNESKNFSLSLGVMGSPDLYLIRSPEDPIYPLPSYYTGSSGLSGGVTFSAKKNNVEILTGLSYSSVSYQPRDYVEVYSSRGKFYQTSLNNIFFNSISIPINFNIYFDLADNSRVYATLGTTFNTIINSNFDIVENQIPQPTGVPSSRTRNSLLDSKDFEEGIFEGGSLFDNTYFTGDIGVGYLHEFKDNWSFYLQPTLHTQYTEGIGPNQDYLHKLSIYAGLKYSL